MRSSRASRKVGIVIVNWNKRRHVLRLLSQLTKQHYDNYEIAVVDNASGDGSSGAIRASYPEVVVLQNHDNLGGSGGFNTGIRYFLRRDHEFIWLLDNDAAIERDTLAQLLVSIEQDATLGIVGSKILNTDNPEFIVKLGAFLDWRRGLVRSNQQNTEDFQSGESIIYVGYVPFCSALVRRECFELINLLDERYFLYWDDTDFCSSALEVGYKTAVVPKSVVYHPAFTEKNTGHNYYLIRNSFLFFSKLAVFPERLLAFHSLVTKYCTKYLLSRLSGQQRQAEIVFLALRDFLVNSFGGADHRIKPISEVREHRINVKVLRGLRVLIVHEGSYRDIEKLVEILRSEGVTVLHVISPFSRASLLKHLGIPLVLLDDRRENLFGEHFRVFLKTFYERYDVAIVSREVSSPFTYVAKHAIVFNPEDNSFTGSDADRTRLILLIVAALVGQMTGLLLLPLFLARGLMLRREWRRSMKDAKKR